MDLSFHVYTKDFKKNLMKPNVLIDNIKFAEGLRWHKDELWFCDLWSKKIYKINKTNQLSCEIELEDQPVSLGWLSDDSLLITSLLERKLLLLDKGILTDYIDLTFTSPGYAHDFTVSSKDYIYISVSGFYPAFEVTPKTSNILLLTPEREIKIAASGVRYPNGIQLIESEKKLLVSETFAASISEFQVTHDYKLIEQKSFYAFDNKGFYVQFDQNGVPRDLTRYYPDGIAYDHHREVLWVASPGRNEVVAVNQYGIQEIINTNLTPFDCVLNESGTRLYIGSSNGNNNQAQGMIEYVDL